MSDWRVMRNGNREDLLAFADTAVQAATTGDANIDYAGKHLSLKDLDRQKVDDAAGLELNNLEDADKGLVIPGKYAIVLGDRAEELRICRDRRRQILGGHRDIVARALSGMYERKKRMEGAR